MDWKTLQWVRNYLQSCLINASQYKGSTDHGQTVKIILLRDMMHDMDLKILEIEYDSLWEAGYGE